jgi:hypothetical protein
MSIRIGLTIALSVALALACGETNAPDAARAELRAKLAVQEEPESLDAALESFFAKAPPKARAAYKLQLKRLLETEGAFLTSSDPDVRALLKRVVAAQSREVALRTAQARATR